MKGIVREIKVLSHIHLQVIRNFRECIFKFLDVFNHFTEQLREDPEMSAAVAAITTLVKLVETNQGI